MKHFTVKTLVTQAMIAAIYAALTIALAPISFGAAQFRISEALTILPFLNPICTVGLSVGCLVSNMVGGYGMLDIVFGTMATALAGILTSKIRNRWLAPLPVILCNGIIVGAVIAYSASPATFWQSIWLTAGQLMVEEAGVCYLLGLPLLTLLQKVKFDQKF